jgi:APA family basic amino acid/polyamine antiporter
LSGLFACKSVESLIAESERPEAAEALPRTLGFFSLTCFGVGSTIGAGIFVLTGTVAAAHAGPAVVLSFVLAGLACALAGLVVVPFF